MLLVLVFLYARGLIDAWENLQPKQHVSWQTHELLSAGHVLIILYTRTAYTRSRVHEEHEEYLESRGQALSC